MSRIAVVAAPRIRPRGAANATHANTRAGSSSLGSEGRIVLCHHSAGGRNMRDPTTHRLVVGVAAMVATLAVHAEPLRGIPDWSSDRFLLGTWSCDVVRSGHKSAREIAVYTLGLSDRWLKLTYTLTSDDPGTPPVKTEAYESFDPKLRKWVYVSMGSDGEYGTTYSDGWNGNTKTYGPEPDAKGKWRLVATKIGDREFSEDIDVAGDGGTWRRTGSLRCSKTD
jgi:hypothetical protein